MNILYKAGLTFTALLSITFLPSIAQAQTEAKPINIGLGFNGGTTITWDRSNEVIQQMWLDNPTFANIDIFGCIRGWQGCTSSDAQIIHIKRNQDLKLKHMPRVSTTLLTVVTQDSKTNATRLHFYQINKSEATTQPLLVAAVTPPPIVRRAVDSRELSKFNMTPAEIAARIDVAIVKVKERSRVSPKLRSLVVFSNMLKKGAKEQHALALSGVSVELVQEVLKR